MILKTSLTAVTSDSRAHHNETSHWFGHSVITFKRNVSTFSVPACGDCSKEYLKDRLNDPFAQV